MKRMLEPSIKLIGEVVRRASHKWGLPSALLGCSFRLYACSYRHWPLHLWHSEWVTQSEGAVQSKSVTSCAGMTAHFVLLAQTKVGFLSGGGSRFMKELPEKEVLAQLEEAYARATVVTRAQKLCIVMGPLTCEGCLVPLRCLLCQFVFTVPNY